MALNFAAVFFRGAGQIGRDARFLAPSMNSTTAWINIASSTSGANSSSNRQWPQNSTFTCTHMLRIPLSVKSRFRKRPDGEVETFLSGTCMNCG